MNSLKIVFMGTPEFALPMLDILHQSEHKIVAVITAPDKPAGRGMNLQQSEVKQYAVSNNLPVLQPEKLKNETFLNELKALNADLFVVVAFRMLPEAVWNMAPFGTINLHASLLPDYRGAAPINWAVINGEKETGITTFKLQHEIDTGDVIYSDKISINEDENVGSVYHRLMEIGAPILLKTVNAIAENNYPQVPQPKSDVPKHAPKIFKETCLIDWNKSANEIHNLIRGLSPYPAAFSKLDGKVLKIYASSKEIFEHNKPIGSYETDGKTYFKFYCKDGAILCHELQLEGKKKMKADEFLRGWKS